MGMNLGLSYWIKNIGCEVFRIGYLGKYLRWAGHAAYMWDRITACRIYYKNLRERDHFEDPGLDGGIIFKWVFKKKEGDIDWTDLAQDMDMWRFYLNMVMMYGFCKMLGISSLAEEL